MSDKICIVGCGKVGASAGFALAVSGIADEIVFIDELPDKARGEALDIADSCVMTKTAVRDGTYADIKDSAVIVFAAGVGRKPGESRFDLAVKNAAITRSVAESIKPHYTSGVILAVTNPVDVVTYIMDDILRLPKGRVVGTGTSLDAARLTDKIAKYFNADKTDVDVCVLGEHGDSAVPVWSLTTIKGTPVAEFAKAARRPWDATARQNLFNDMKTAGAEIIAMKGATFYGVATCIVKICREILQSTNARLHLSAKLNGEYGIRDTAVSLSATIGRDGLKGFLTPPLNKDELALLRESAGKVEAEIRKL